MTSSDYFRDLRGIAGLPAIFRYPEAAVRALAGLVAHAERKARPAVAQPVPVTARSTVIGRARGGGDYLSPQEAFALLEEIGIAVAPWRAVHGRGELAGAGRALGYPVVLKAVAEKLVHKSEAGGVVVGLADERALIAAFEGMEKRLTSAGIEAGGFLVQRQVCGGREVIVGVTRDPAVGPLVMVGLGGVAVEMWKDVSFRVAPISSGEASAMLDELRGACLLRAFRGQPAGDRPALEEAVVRLAGLAAAHPEIAECDVNPLLVMDAGKGCVAVDVRVRVAG
jgi:acetyltransferase